MEGDGLGLAEVDDAGASTPAPPPDLVRQLGAWAERSGAAGIPVPVLALGLAAWTRLHGSISLELGGHLESMQVDPAPLFTMQVKAIAAQARAIAVAPAVTL